MERIKVGPNGERKILVPFSQEEIERLQKMRDLHETMGEQIKVSGVMRQLLAVAKIPDGYALKDRGMAIEHMKELAELYRKALEDEHFANSVAPFREKLTEINQGLRSFFEEN